MADLRDPQIASGVFRERHASLLHRLLGDSQAHAAAAKFRFQRALHFRYARLRQRGNVLDRQRQSSARLRVGDDLFRQLARGRVPLLGSGGSYRNQRNKDCQRKEKEHTLAAGGHPKAQISRESRIIAFHSHGSWSVAPSSADGARWEWSNAIRGYARLTTQAYRDCTGRGGSSASSCWRMICGICPRSTSLAKKYLPSAGTIMICSLSESRSAMILLISSGDC